jgi:hypothetical protein
MGSAFTVIRQWLILCGCNGFHPANRGRAAPASNLEGSIMAQRRSGCRRGFARSVAPRPPFPPALQRWALQVRLSMDCVSDSSSCTSWWNMLCQMPTFDHRLNRL